MKSRMLSLLVVLAGLADTPLAAPRTVVLEVENMSCPVCPLTVRKALEKVPGVHRVTVDYAGKTATVEFDDGAATPEQLTAATATAGYPSRLGREER